MDKSAKSAMQQINLKNYHKRFALSGKPITKVGINIDAVLEDIVQNVPAPTGDVNAPLKALIFDSQYDSYRGVIVYMRLMEGTIRTGQTVKLMATGATYQVIECGHLLPLGL